MKFALQPDEQVVPLLQNGDLEVLGILPNASNYTFLARVAANGAEVKGVYKPRTGEAPLWDFPDGTLCNREVAAYVVARHLGWPAVPPTVLRDGPEGPGSLQLFIEFDPNEHFFTLREKHQEEFRRVAAFDAIVNNADRKGGHCLLGSDGRIHVIDHGVCFNADPKLRTVVWDFAGEPLPDELANDLQEFGLSLRGGDLRRSLESLLDAAEMDSLAARTSALVESQRFPVPGSGRPYPWPMI